MNRKIFIDQCGYKNDWIKRVTFVSRNPVEFEVRKSTGETVFSGMATVKYENISTGEINYVGNFTDVNESGIYYVWSLPFGESEYFTIGENAYDDVIRKSLDFFYLQRCGCALPQNKAGIFSHNACHTEPAKIYGTEEYCDVSGGWHDAGDYGRYIVPAAMTVMQLLWSNRLYGTDFYDELKYELDFMLKMQREDGRVYHKVSCKNFCGFIMPEEEKDELVLSPVSVTATADFASAIAMASEYFKEIDKNYADVLRNAAVKAYDSLNDFELPGGFINPSDINTGQYEDDNDLDEKYTAASIMYKVFGNEKYRQDFENLAKENIYHGYGWSDMGSYGNIEYLESGREINSELAEQIRSSMIKLADKLLINVNTDGYSVSLGEKDYIWGSNLSVCCNGLHLVDAYKLTGDVKYLNAAREQIHYLLGRNSLGLCFVTECGTYAVRRPHHRPSAYVGHTMPGMLSGGPCDWRADPIVQNLLEKDTPSAKMFVDMNGSYSTNEITIYWNSAMILLFAKVI